MIPYARQDISDADIREVVDVLRSDFLTQGPAIPTFEQALAAYCGAPHAVSANSGTSALHIACLALGVGPGDWVWTSPITFVASATCALQCGARVDFVDIDARTCNLCVERLAEKLAQAERVGLLPKVVVAVHFAGQSCEMTAIRALGQRYGFAIIEDASHALGGRYRDKPVGNGQHSDITVFSFHAIKIVTTGEGGAAVTNNAELARRMRRLRSHGITRDVDEMSDPPDGAWHYQQLELGFNYRMTDLQAALGTSQVRRLDEFVARRHAIAAEYDRALRDWPLERPWQHPDAYSAWHLYVVRLALADIPSTRRGVFDALRAAGVQSNVHYVPVYLQPYFARLGFRRGYCPEAERYYAEAITLPMHARFTESEQCLVVSALRTAIDADP